jgi:hypothetical protein
MAYMPSCCVVLVSHAFGKANREQGYIIDVFGPGYDAAEEMGLLPAIKDFAYRPEEASLVDEHGRRRAGLPYELVAAASTRCVTAASRCSLCTARPIRACLLTPVLRLARLPVVSHYVGTVLASR